jgi:hypothetical protein
VLSNRGGYIYLFFNNAVGMLAGMVAFNGSPSCNPFGAQRPLAAVKPAAAAGLTSPGR